ncbi:nucleotidyltransferase domain-containing protein [Persephonella sp.]
MMVKVKDPFRYLTDKEKRAVLQFKEKVLQIEPEAKLILYGSKARGDYHEESDIDVLVVVPDLDWSKKRKILDTAVEVEEKHGFSVLLGVMIIDKYSFEKSPVFKGSLYYRNVKEEGVLL